MTGVIITGHGTFGSGVESNVRFLVGDQEGIRSVDFMMGEGTQQLSEKLEAALTELKDLPQILIFTDIVSGSPFQQAVMLTHNRPNVRVIYGTNTPMVIELCMRNFTGSEPGDLDQLVQELVKIGREQIDAYGERSNESDVPDEGI